MKFIIYERQYYFLVFRYKFNVKPVPLAFQRYLPNTLNWDKNVFLTKFTVVTRHHVIKGFAVYVFFARSHFSIR